MKGPTVVWVESAEQELASIWLTLSDRNKVSMATHEIDRALKHDAIRERRKISWQSFLVHHCPTDVELVGDLATGFPADSGRPIDYRAGEGRWWASAELGTRDRRHLLFFRSSS